MNKEMPHVIHCQGSDKESWSAMPGRSGWVPRGRTARLTPPCLPPSSLLSLSLRLPSEPLHLLKENRLRRKDYS